jgi:hypothetical protein
MAFVAWTAWTRLVARWPILETHVLVPLTIAAISVLTILNVVDAATAGVPQPIYSRPLGALAPQILRSIPPGPGVVVVRRPPVEFWWPGVVVALERRGIPVRVDTDPVVLLGAHRRHQDERVRAFLTIATGRDALSERPHERRIAFWAACAPERLRRDLEQSAIIDAQYRRGKLSAAAYLHGVKTLCTSAVGVFIDDPSPTS